MDRGILTYEFIPPRDNAEICPLNTSDAADERPSVEPGAPRIMNKKNTT